MKLIKFFFLFFLSVASLKAQTVNVPVNSDYNHLIERYEIKLGGFNAGIHTSIKPFTRRGIAMLADSLSADSSVLSKSDQFNIQYLKNDNWEWSLSDQADSKAPILKKFYRKKSNFYSVDIPDFNLHVNPVMYFGIGNDEKATGRPYISTRGVELRGMISKKIGFYTFLTDNQISTPAYVQGLVNETGVVPNEGFWKSYGTKKGGYDFFHTRGYISFDPIKNINVQFGHDKFFVGNGYRSLILSDFAAPLLFLKFNTKVWRINYTNLFAQLKADVFGNEGGLFGSKSFPNKYFAFHHLSLNITDNLNIGVFESVVFGKSDSLGPNNFDLNYLNPIIFYRSIEQHQGSQDNSLLGVDFKWILFKRISLYGQFTLDEFLLSEVKAGKGWWGNKFAAQAGAKYIDVAGIKNLDIQGEINIARPFTYSHDNNFTNYTHYLQPLAHPLGANFREVIGIIRYQPFPKLFFTFKGIYAKKGLDTSKQNYGGDVLKSYNSRSNDYGNSLGQGVPSDIKFIDFTISYMLKHNLWIDLKQVYRENNTTLPGKIKTDVFTFAALRLNIWQRNYDF